jgi:hypothetical protein
MPKRCQSCNREDLADDFSFCPYCGTQIREDNKCPECGYEITPDLNFCPKCGTSLKSKPEPGAAEARIAKPRPAAEIVDVEPPPAQGITIEFLHSSSSSFEFAVTAAKAFSSFREFGEGRKATYRVTVAPQDLAQLTDLIGYVKGWRRRDVYVDGEKLPWDAVFRYTWCYERRAASFKPQFYCFGYEERGQLNPWGCIQARLPFDEHQEWCTWGRWLNKRGDWRFDKERIQHELQKSLFQYRFCPAIDLALVDRVLEAFPETVNPNGDRDWKFVQTWDDNAAGLVVTVRQYGFDEKQVMVGAAPDGPGALRELTRRVRGLSLPLPAS